MSRSRRRVCVLVLAAVLSTGCTTDPGTPTPDTPTTTTGTTVDPRFEERGGE